MCSTLHDGFTFFLFICSFFCCVLTKRVNNQTRKSIHFIKSNVWTFVDVVIVSSCAYVCACLSFTSCLLFSLVLIVQVPFGTPTHRYAYAQYKHIQTENQPASMIHASWTELNWTEPNEPKMIISGIKVPFLYAHFHIRCIHVCLTIYSLWIAAVHSLSPVWLRACTYVCVRVCAFVCLCWCVWARECVCVHVLQQALHWAIKRRRQYVWQYNVIAYCLTRMLLEIWIDSTKE